MASALLVIGVLLLALWIGLMIHDFRSMDTWWSTQRFVMRALCAFTGGYLIGLAISQGAI